jgi:hypothetical protein
MLPEASNKALHIVARVGASRPQTKDLKEIGWSSPCMPWETPSRVDVWRVERRSQRKKELHSKKSRGPRERKRHVLIFWRRLSRLNRDIGRIRMIRKFGSSMEDCSINPASSGRQEIRLLH